MTALRYAAAGPGQQWYNQTKTFNVRGQLTRMTATGAADTGYTTPQTVDLQYNFSGTVNDGRLTSRQDLVSGEAVNYTFDTLGRLTYANNTGTSPWSQTFTYDGFGNLLTETGSGGAPTKTLSVDPTTNRINSSGYSYDLAGNLTAMPGITSMVYDKNNRLSQATVAGGTEKYGYNPAGQRAWMLSTSGAFTVYFYGVNGELLATYHHDYGSCHCTAAAGPYVYFAGKKIWDGAGMVEDRLGSEVETSGASAASYYPFGELKSGTASQFATYQRQSATGLDYAQQRWYSSQVMRFTSPDRVNPSNALVLPGNWNRFSYVGGDPINKADPLGMCSPEDDPPCFSVTGTDTWALEFLLGATPGERKKPNPNWENQFDAKVDVREKAERTYVNAIFSALAALLDPKCAAIFNTDPNRPHTYSPHDVLAGFVFGGNGTPNFGTLRKGRIPLLYAGVSVWDRNTVVSTGSGAIAASADIIIQSNTLSDGYYGEQSVRDLAITLIHELGHVFEMVSGLGGSKIINDSGLGDSINWNAEAKNDKTVRDACDPR